jgi:hypothetical protein
VGEASAISRFITGAISFFKAGSAGSMITSSGSSDDRKAAKAEEIDTPGRYVARKLSIAASRCRLGGRQVTASSISSEIAASSRMFAAG